VNILYASFDAVPSFKAASTHILANCRETIRRHHVTLVTLGDVCLPSCTNFIHHAAYLPEPNLLRRGLAFRRLVARRMECERPDVVHFRTPWEGMAAVRLRLPSVYEVNGLPSVELPYVYGSATPRVLAILRHWELTCLDHATRIVCPAIHIRDFLVREMGVRDSGRIVVIPNGYDPIGAPAVPATSHTLRAVYLGTLHPWQGIHWAVRAFTELRGRWELVIHGIGRREWLERMRRRIHRRGLEDVIRLEPPLDRGRLSVELAGFHVGIAPLLDTARNSEQGCCPVKVMDYLAHGLVTVAADLPVVRSLIRHGDNGVLFQPNSLRGFTEAMLSLHAARSSLAEARRRVLDSLSRMPTWNECSRRLVDVYEATAANSRR
jgi:glycosyltransferase involved in cell wall biosynthesis